MVISSTSFRINRHVFKYATEHSGNNVQEIRERPVNCNEVCECYFETRMEILWERLFLWAFSFFLFCVGSFVLAGVTIALSHVPSGLLQIWHNYGFLYGAGKTAFTAECHIVVYNFAYNLGK